MCIFFCIENLQWILKNIVTENYKEEKNSPYIDYVFVNSVMFCKILWNSVEYVLQEIELYMYAFSFLRDLNDNAESNKQKYEICYKLFMSYICLHSMFLRKLWFHKNRYKIRNIYFVIKYLVDCLHKIIYKFVLIL